jgi:hypothetical protein
MNSPARPTVDLTKLETTITSINAPNHFPPPARPTTERPPSELEFHSLANLFPLANDDELKVLAEDIKTNGLQQPITLYNGHILDGRNRHRACKIAGKEPRTIELQSGVDPIAFVVSANLHRRHLNETQRGIVAAKLANMRVGGKEANPSKDGIAQRDAAKLLNVSTKTVERASKLVKAGKPELVAAAEQGKVKVAAAVKFITKRSDSEQQRLVTENGDIVKAVESLKPRSTANENDSYANAEKRLIERLQKLPATKAKDQAEVTIKNLKTVVNTMLSAVQNQAKAA